MKRNHSLLLVTVQCSVTKAQIIIQSLLLPILCVLAIENFAQSLSSGSLTPNPYYYWYKNQKVYLQLNTSKKFLLLKDTVADSTALAQRIGNSSFKSGKVSRSNVLSGLKKHKPDTLLSEKKYCIVENINKDTSFANNADVLYEAPAFNYNNIEVVLSHIFYVKLKHDTDLTQLQTLAVQHTVEILGNNRFMPLWFTLACSKQSSGNAMQMANLFYETGLFAFAEPDLMSKNNLSSCPPNDPYFANQWNLQNTGQYTQLGDYIHPDIDLCGAWQYTQGSDDVIVAVVDVGVQLNHPDLTNMHPVSYDSENMTSPSVLTGGFFPEHGTACAGIIGANADNNIGVAGIAPQCPIMSISNAFLVTMGQSLANAVNFAWHNGASVINNSWGQDTQYQILDDAIADALAQGRNGLGCVVVFATGNDNNFFGGVSYPANSHPDIIAVGAISPCGERWNPNSCGSNSFLSGSNYGSELDIVAPGRFIPTTDLTGTSGASLNDYVDYYGGTSSAAPHVAAAAALMLAVNPWLSQQQVGDILTSNAVKINPNNIYTYSTLFGYPNGTWNNEMGYGLLNAGAAVYAAKNLCNGGFADLYMKDQHSDFGQEPYIPQDNVTWNSPDIWLRKQPDGFTNHNSQNAEYGQANYIYVKVRNRGCSASLGTEQLKLYWAKAATAMAWSNVWTGGNNTPSIQWGDYIGSQTINSLQTGEHTILQFTWYPPNPADYASINASPWHYCLLARIETSANSPYGMTNAETSSVAYNVKYNNNIVQKNVSVYDIIPNSTFPQSIVIRVGNIHDDVAVNGRKFGFSIPFEQQSYSILEYAQVKLHLDKNLMQKWITGGMQGESVELIDDDSSIVFLNHGAWIGNISFEPEEYHTMSLEVTPVSDATQDNTPHFSFDIIQYDYDNSAVGGERFEIEFNNNEEQQRIAGDTIFLPIIQNLYITPPQPTTDDTIKMMGRTFFMDCPPNSSVLSFSPVVNINDNFISVDGHYAWYGSLFMECEITDTVNLGKLAAGNYKLFYTVYQNKGNLNNNIIQDTASILFTVISTVGIKENQSELLQYLSLRPNPAANKLTISSNKNINDLQIQIVNLTGASLLSTNCKSNCEIDISQLPEGLYFVNIYQKEKFVGVKKLVVMR